MPLSILKTQLKDYFRTDFRIYWKWNKPKRSTTFSIDIQNVLNRKNEAYQYFDQVQQQVVTKEQLGLIPLVAYRWSFEVGLKKKELFAYIGFYGLLYASFLSADDVRFFVHLYIFDFPLTGLQGHLTFYGYGINPTWHGQTSFAVAGGF
jgi:hypothetical protein